MGQDQPPTRKRHMNRRRLAITRWHLLTTVVLTALVAASSAQPLPDPLLSDNATEAEVKRIDALPIPPPELMAGPSQEAQMQAQQYASLAQRSFGEAAIADEPNRRERVSKLAADVVKSANPCDEQKLATALRSLQTEFTRLGTPLQSYEFSSAFSSINQGVAPEDAVAADTVLPLLGERARVDVGCNPQVKAFFGSTKFTQAIGAALRIQERQAKNVVAGLEAQKPRAERLAKAWTQRYSTLVSRLESQKKATVDLFVAQLPWIIGVFCVFALSVIATVRLFGPELQMEWVASGQVIQFASVMILLVVVTTLRILEKIDGQTVGTLLGGIAGYVLSQGVGRAAARAVERHVQGRGGSAVAEGDGVRERESQGDAGR